MKQRLVRVWMAWSRFWFESNAPAQMTVLRGLLGFTLFGFYLVRCFDLQTYYSEGGMLPLAVMFDVMPMQYRLSLLHHFSSDAAVWGLHTIFLASLLTLALGIAPRLSAITAFVLHVSFLHRNLTVIFGVDMIATFFLLYLCFADFRHQPGKRQGPEVLAATLGSMAFRLVQIQVCIIYAYSGLEKLKGGDWWRGEALWDVLANAQIARWDYSWVAEFPLAVVAATYLTLAWEIYFPALIWSRKWRYPMLVFGVLMHFGIAVSVNLPFFGALMILSYSVFLREEHALALIHLFQKKNSRSPAGVSNSTVSGLEDLGGYSKPRTT